MIRALRTGASGMTAQQLNVDTIANNLSNINTTGFKRSKVEFQDVLYQNIRRAGTSAAGESIVPVNLEIGYGAKPISTSRIFSEGSLNPTDQPLDLAITGDGFFQIALPLAALEWIRTLYFFAQMRIESGQPWTRLAIILGLVALLTVLSALVFKARTLRCRYGLQDSS